MATDGSKAVARKRASASSEAQATTDGAFNARDEQALDEVLRVLTAARDGDFSARVRSRRRDVVGEVQQRCNELIALNARQAKELARVSRIIGREGRMTERVSLGTVDGAWTETVESVNAMIDDLVHPTTEISRVIQSVARGDLSQKMPVTIAGQPVKGELAAIGTTVNEMVDQLGSFADEVTRVSREVGTEGQLGGQAEVKGVSGIWRDLTENVNSMAANLTNQVRQIATVTTAVANGDLSQKITVEARGEIAELKDTINTMVDQLSSFGAEVTRVAREVGTEGQLGGQAEVKGASGTWRDLTENVNLMATNLTDQVRQIAAVTTAVAQGDLTQKVTVEAKGEVQTLADTINSMTDTLREFAEQVTVVARAVGTDGQLGGQAEVRGVSGTWKDLTDSVNTMASNLTDQVRQIATVTTAVANGDLTQKVTVEAKGEIATLAETINSMTERLRVFGEQVTGVARAVGTEGMLGGQAEVEGASGTWRDLTDSVNEMASNLTSQVRNIAQVTTAVANGDLSQEITVDARGEIHDLKQTINTMVGQLSSFADEVTRVAREVGTEGRLGGQAKVKGVSGTWRDLTESVNFLASNLTDQVRNIAQVTTAVANGDLSKKITVEARGEIAELKDTINTMVEQLNSFAAEVSRVAREVGTEGKLGGLATVEGVSGTWRGLTDNVNLMAGNLTDQVRAIARVTTAVANGDLSKKVAIEAKGEIYELSETINTMVDQLSSFADEVTRVAREVGTEGRLGGQAEVKGVSGTWRDLTENVNSMAGNLTDQVRNIAQVATAVANGDLSQKITVDARGEIFSLKQTLNTMVDQLSSFAAEVTRVAREVGTEGQLGGQAEVEGVSGTWRRLTENVNQLAGNLTTQVRAIAEVSTAVTQGDLTRQIAVDARGEVAELSDTINLMIANLRATTQRNAESDWLNTNLARISGMMQGQRDLATVARLIMSEISPLISAQHGAFFSTETDEGREPELRLIASYGYRKRKSVSNAFTFGEGLVGQAALETHSILVSDAPQDYVKVSSGLGDALPVNIIVIPILFEEQVLAVVELASLRAFSDVDLTFLEQLAETLGVVLNAIIASRRTEELLEQSQSLAEELQSQSEELQSQQQELRRSNAELEQQTSSLRASEELLQTQQEELQQTNEELQEKAELLSQQNRDIEVQNTEIEKARADLEEKAAQLSLSSTYKSEFLANMSHELRTPLNSLLILSKLLAENPDQNLTDKQIEFASTIHTAGADLLSLISDILDLSKVEAGKMEVHPGELQTSAIRDYVERAFGPVAEQKGLDFDVTTADDVPHAIFTDEQRVQQVLRNLLSNAFKFTQEGSVSLELAAAGEDSGHTLRIIVRDSGIGIAEDKLRLIFEAFQQADGTTSRRYGGTGLGLSISREIVRVLGGRLTVQSAPGDGSAFELLLSDYVPKPVAAVAAAEQPEQRPRTAVPVLAPAAGDPAGAASAPADDRSQLLDGDRVALVIHDDNDAAQVAIDEARGAGFRAVAAPLGNEGLALAQELIPDVIVLSVPEHGGAGVLEQLKQHAHTRHVPVHVIADAGDRHTVLSAGAAGFHERPAGNDELAGAFASAAEFLDHPVRRLLVVDDDEAQRLSITELVAGDDVEVTAVATSEAALEAIAERRYDCIVLDLKLPQMTGFALLDHLKEDEEQREVPVIIHTGTELTRREETRLRRYADSIIVKDAGSPERLLSETAMFLHRSQSAMPAESRRMLERLHATDTVLQGKRVLIVDDDVRNVFALTSALETRGMVVRFAENGREAIESLEADDAVDLVLMDVMMPEMDGHETTRALRADDRFADLPVIALTAKAMKGDREKSIAAGASDYITKPVDIEQLISLMRVWLYG